MNAAPTSTEDRLRAAMDHLLDEHDTDLVLDAVARRGRHPHRRRTSRTSRTGRSGRSGRAFAGIAAAAAVIAVLLAAVSSGRSHPDVVAGPSPTPDPVPTTTAVQGDDHVGAPLELPGVGELTSALGGDGTDFWLASTGPNAVTQVGNDGTVGPTTRLEGSARLATADASSLWVLVDEADGTDRPWRLKRIDRADGRLLSSSRVQLDGVPVGLARVGDRTVVSTDRATVTLNDAGALVDRRSSIDDLSVSSDAVRWTVLDEVATSTTSDGRSSSSRVPGVRRLVPAPAAAAGGAALERLVGGKVEVELRTSADGTATHLVTLPASATTAAVTAEAVWVLDRGAVQQHLR